MISPRIPREAGTSSEAEISAFYATYASLEDMLNDSNRLSEVTPNSMETGRYIVGTGAAIAATAAPVPEISTWAMMLAASERSVSRCGGNRSSYSGPPDDPAGRLTSTDGSPRG